MKMEENTTEQSTQPSQPSSETQLCSSFSGLLSSIIVDAANVLLGNFGINPGWNWAEVPCRSSPVVINAGTNTPASEIFKHNGNHFDLRTIDQSIGAAYHASGGSTITINTGGQVYMGIPKAIAAGSLQELESHFEQIKPSSFDRRMSFQFQRRDGKKSAAYYIGTIQGSSVVKTMCVYSPESHTDKDWEHLLSKQIESLQDTELSDVCAQVYGFCRTSFTTTIVYNGALVPLYRSDRHKTYQIKATPRSRMHNRSLMKITVSDKALRWLDRWDNSMLNNPKFQKVSKVSPHAQRELRSRYSELHRYWQLHGYRQPHCVFVRIDTGQLVIMDSKADSVKDPTGSRAWRPISLDGVQISALYYELVSPELPEAWTDVRYTWTCHTKEEEEEAMAWREAALRRDPILERYIEVLP